MATIFYGSDTSCVTDMSYVDTLITNPSILIGQRLARRLQTPRGALAAINDDPNFGWDCNQYVNAKLTPAQINNAQATIQAECLKDEQVQAININFVLSGGVLAINASGIAATGPFQFTLNISQVTSNLIFGST